MRPEPPASYSQNARPVGFPLTLRLAGDRLLVESHVQAEEVALREAESVRLTFEPRSLARRAFRTSVRFRDGRTVRFTSLTWKGMARVEEQGAEYRAFLGRLVPAIARHSPDARFLAGKPAPLWWAIVALSALAAVGVALFTGRAFLSGESQAGLLALLVAAAGTWQVAPFVRRNRPRLFAPDAIPADLLP